jgi:hypothetical protein
LSSAAIRRIETASTPSASASYRMTTRTAPRERLDAPLIRLCIAVLVGAVPASAPRIRSRWRS